jgi:hypothetical protein
MDEDRAAKRLKEDAWADLNDSYDAELIRSGVRPVVKIVAAFSWPNDDPELELIWWYVSEDTTKVFTIQAGTRFVKPGTISDELAYNIFKGRWPPERYACCSDCARRVFSSCDGSTDFQQAIEYCSIECGEFEFDAPVALTAVLQEHSALADLTRGLVAYTPKNDPYLVDPSDALRERVADLEDLVKRYLPEGLAIKR